MPAKGLCDSIGLNRGHGPLLPGLQLKMHYIIDKNIRYFLTK
jgi:hypothetical protein